MFTLIEVPFEIDALEPVISARTLEFHHGKHLQAYIDNLNKLLPGSEFEAMCHSERSEESMLQDIIRTSPPGPIFNNAGQILNHNLYFKQFTSRSSNLSKDRLMSQFKKQWGTLEAFKADFESKGVTLFGSGWVWLSAKSDGTLVITQELGAGNPVTKGLKPLLTFDVWEHAYYLDYQNRRASHLTALWQIIDWSVIENRYNKSL